MYKVILNQNIVYRTSTKKRALELADKIVKAFIYGTIVVKDCKTNGTVTKIVIDNPACKG